MERRDFLYYPNGTININNNVKIIQNSYKYYRFTSYDTEVAGGGTIQDPAKYTRISEFQFYNKNEQVWGKCKQHNRFRSSRLVVEPTGALSDGTMNNYKCAFLSKVGGAILFTLSEAKPVTRIRFGNGNENQYNAEQSLLHPSVWHLQNGFLRVQIVILLYQHLIKTTLIDNSDGHLPNNLVPGTWAASSDSSVYSDVTTADESTFYNITPAISASTFGGDVAYTQIDDSTISLITNGTERLIIANGRVGIGNVSGGVGNSVNSVLDIRSTIKSSIPFCSW